ncbi:MAG: hypothetical protein U0166_19555 [Acidobacteriota bacterium]
MRLVDEDERAFGEPTEMGEERSGGFGLEATAANASGGAEAREEAERADGGHRGGDGVVAGDVEGTCEEAKRGALAGAALGDDGVAGEREAQRWVRP